jgi:choline transport protein
VRAKTFRAVINDPITLRNPNMSADNDSENIIPSVSPPDSILGQKSIDKHALKLAKMGYTRDLRRNFSVWSVLGVGFSLTNSWFAISAALIPDINSGGPLLLMYGIIAVTFISICVRVGLSELASAFPKC